LVDILLTQIKKDS